MSVNVYRVIIKVGLSAAWVFWFRKYVVAFFDQVTTAKITDFRNMNPVAAPIVAPIRIFILFAQIWFKKWIPTGEQITSFLELLAFVLL